MGAATACSSDTTNRPDRGRGMGVRFRILAVRRGDGTGDITVFCCASTSDTEDSGQPHTSRRRPHGEVPALALRDARCARSSGRGRASNHARLLCMRLTGASPRWPALLWLHWTISPPLPLLRMARIAMIALMLFAAA